MVIVDKAKGSLLNTFYFVGVGFTTEMPGEGAIVKVGYYKIVCIYIHAWSHCRGGGARAPVPPPPAELPLPLRRPDIFF